MTNIIKLRKILAEKSPKLSGDDRLDRMRRTMMTPVRPIPDDYHPERIIGWIMIFVAVWTIVGALMLWLAWPAHAMDHGFDHSNAVVQWFDNLLRPDDLVPPRSTCCGKAEAYEIEILQEAIGQDGDDMGIARVTNGGEREFPDHMIRPPPPNGLEFHFPKSKVNPPADGNPTNTAWAFLSIISGDRDAPNQIRLIYCVVPLPPGS